MKAQQAVSTTQDSISRFHELMTDGVNSWIAAGEIAAAAIDEDPTWADQVCSEHREITHEIVNKFVMIGRHQLHPRLLLNGNPGSRALRRLPFEVQEKHITQPVPLLVNVENKWEELAVDINNLTTTQAAQVFGTDSVRSPAAQRAWIESRNTAAAAAAASAPQAVPYRIASHKLVVMQPCSFTVKELARLIAEMQ